MHCLVGQLSLINEAIYPTVADNMLETVVLVAITVPLARILPAIINEKSIANPISFSFFIFIFSLFVFVKTHTLPQ